METRSKKSQADSKRNKGGQGESSEKAKKTPRRGGGQDEGEFSNVRVSGSKAEDEDRAAVEDKSVAGSHGKKAPSLTGNAKKVQQLQNKLRAIEELNKIEEERDKRRKLQIQTEFELRNAVLEEQDDDDDINEFDYVEEPLVPGPPADPVEAVNEWVRYGRSNHNLPTLNVPSVNVNNMTSNTANVLEKLLARQSVPKDLPAFSGEPGEWQLFIRQYEHTTNMCGLTDEENAMRLVKCLKGKAHDAVCAMLGIPENVSLVIETLKMTFGRPDLIVKSLIQKAKSVPAPHENRPDTVIAFCNAVQCLVATMKNLRCTGHMKNPQLLEELVQRLPSNFQMHWCMYVVVEKPEHDLEDFSKWLKNVAAAACHMPSSMSSNDDNGSSQKSKEKKDFKKTVQPSTSEKKVPTDCPKCKQTGHQLGAVLNLKNWTLRRSGSLSRTGGSASAA